MSIETKRDGLKDAADLFIGSSFCDYNNEFFPPNGCNLLSAVLTLNCV
jgi:hypothetical protein